MNMHYRIAAHAAIVACALSATACDDDEQKSTTDSGVEDAGDVAIDDGKDAGVADKKDADVSDPASDAATDEPVRASRFVAASQVYVGMSATSYLVVTNSVTSGALSLDHATELAGSAIVASPGKAGHFYVGTSEGPEVTRYTLDEDDKPVAGKKVSFLSKGVASIGEYQTQFQFISDTKAYYFDARTAQVVVWNPTAMTVTTTIDLKDLVAANQIVAFSSTPTRRGDDVIMPVGFRSSDNSRIVGGAAAVIIDSKDDSFEIARDGRCGYVRDAVTAADGAVYIATEAYGAAVHRIASANAPTPCLLRILPGENAFDADFYVDLNALAEGATAGSLALLPSGKSYIHVLDEAKTTIGNNTNARVLASASAWSWSEIALGDEPTLTAVAGLPATAGSIIAFPTDEAFLVADFVNFSESTNLRNLSDGSGDVTLSADGLLFSLTQVD